VTTTATAADEHEALQLHVRGVVQGVGFRPFVHRLALRHRLTGWVRNEAGSVHIRVEGEGGAVRAFVRALRVEAPPLARIEALESGPAAAEGCTSFEVRPSDPSDGGSLPVSPDVALCAACEAELLDPADRRHGYPFVTCTDCGPRFTVIEAMPYDRERTSMRTFAQCPECVREYRDPSDRRHHSQTNGCPSCGPRVWLEDAHGEPLEEDGDAMEAAAAALVRGEILAVRGLGGYHLAVDATYEPAVRRLRARKSREAKPLAVMVATLAGARRLAGIDAAEARLLMSPERPVVLLRRADGAGLAPSVSPGLETVGVMLAYTPLHRLLLERVGRPLVMTSGNRSDEPIATGCGEARARLRGIADAFLQHDREIVARYDDSVARVVDGSPLLLRRARGYAPLPLPLPVPAPVPLLAVGPHLKNTFTLAEGSSAYVSQHVGDLENLETLEHFRAALGRFRTLFRVEPRIAVRDLHPGYLSTRIAEELGLERTLAVQHHHAHIAAVAAEHGVTTPVVGLAFDGTGYGEDGCVWGAEILVADLAGYRRAGRLRYAPLPGGDLAAREPWRAALGYLSLEPDAAPAFAAAFRDVPEPTRALAEVQAARGLNAPVASSMGRLFDAAAAVLGVRGVSRYEGEAAMALEALAGRSAAAPLPFTAELDVDGVWVLDPLPLLAALGEGRARGTAVPELAAAFHESVAAAAAWLAARVARADGLSTVALGGGVFQNARLLSGVRARLRAGGLRVLVPRRLSPNDGAVSYGQAAAPPALLQREEGV
jgi:hydrogenase maturation protein HypF